MILGAAGMIGQKLVKKLIDLTSLNEVKINKLILFDIVNAPHPEIDEMCFLIKSGDLSKKTVCSDLISEKPDVIFHLAAVVSGQAEKEFDLGWNVNAKGSWNLFESIRSIGNGYCPKLVFSSSIAAFGAPFPNKINDEFFTTPLTSYGA